ncbi:MAG: restriction endonuclease subunit S, partial [Anaerolineae bacterium]|nr:restriction endonuclease subunit S [Anaerolineae bacterium]
PSSASPMVFGVRLGDVMKNNRFNADYFHPERTTILQAIYQQYQDNSKSLGDIVKFMRDIVTVSENDNYMGLASVQSHTGERITVDEMADGQAFQFQAGDVLYGRLRPYLNKVYHAEGEGLCSTEFHVMRVLDENIIMSAYLATLLRTKVILNQTKHMMSGNTHPRLTNDDVINLLIPIPPTDTQQRIVDELYRRRDRARQLRQEADMEWAQAQHRFEQALIG